MLVFFEVSIHQRIIDNHKYFLDTEYRIFTVTLKTGLKNQQYFKIILPLKQNDYCELYYPLTK